MSNDKDLEEEFNEDEIELVSKSQLKREMTALQKLGESLIDLTAEQRAKIPLDDKLREAIEEAPRITQKSGRRRHLQFIGKLMRKADSEAIQQAYDQLKADSVRLTRQHHQLEKWRDDLLSPNNAAALGAFLEQYPAANRQQLNQIIRAAHKEGNENKPPASARKLFKFIRDTVAEKG